MTTKHEESQSFDLKTSALVLDQGVLLIVYLHEKFPRDTKEIEESPEGESLDWLPVSMLLIEHYGNMLRISFIGWTLPLEMGNFNKVLVEGKIYLEWGGWW